MSLSKYKHLLYPANLWSTVFEEQVSTERIPLNWEETLNVAFSLLKDRQMCEILHLYFRDGLFWEEIGLKYGISAGLVRKTANIAIRILRRPPVRYLLLSGATKESGTVDYAAPFQEIPANTPSISDLNLGTRAYNSLRRANICTISQLLQHTEADLLRLSYMGKCTLENIKTCLSAKGYSLPQA